MDTLHVDAVHESVDVALCRHSDDVNPWAGWRHPEVDTSDFAQPSEGFRALLYGRADWFVPITKTPGALTDVFDSMEDTSNVETSVAPYLEEIAEALHHAMLNWVVLKLPAGGTLNLFRHRA